MYDELRNCSLANPSQLSETFEDVHPRWSPNGKMVAFIGRLKDIPYYPFSNELFIINDDGTGLRQLTDYSSSSNYARYPCWDPNTADYVYYCKAWPATRTIVHRVNIDTLDDIEIPSFQGSNTRLWDITSDGFEYLFGREISCCSTPSQYTGYQDMAGTYERIIKPTDGYAERIGRINRDDNWIIYAESHGSSGAYPPDNIYKMDDDGNFVTQLTFGVGGEASGYPVWTQGDNNGYIIFESNHFGNYEIVMMKAETTEYPAGLINLTLDSSSDRYPDWTPYGSAIEPKEVFFDDFDYETLSELLNTSSWFTKTDKQDLDMYYPRINGMDKMMVYPGGSNYGVLELLLRPGDTGPVEEDDETIRFGPELATINTYTKGTYVAKVWFSDKPKETKDHIIQSFWIQTAAKFGGEERYAECDFEYYAYDFETKPAILGRPPTMRLTTWEQVTGIKKRNRNRSVRVRVPLGGKLNLICKYFLPWMYIMKEKWPLIFM
jgi:hypothetical protein